MACRPNTYRPYGTNRPENVIKTQFNQYVLAELGKLVDGMDGAEQSADVEC